jgi:MFS superfamily sulfate permease-like transporter
MPLSLGIAKASDFPPVMGLFTAIIGGLVVSFFAGSRLTIKGPAAGLIVIISGAVTAFGGGEQGWRLTLGAIVVAGIIQILFGVFKWGRLVDFFPLSAVHGMLAAIGIIIVLKQVPVLLDIDPQLYKGQGPFALLAGIPGFMAHLDPRATLIGVVSLAIMMGWHQAPVGPLRKIPAALLVLLISIPAELVMDFEHTEPSYALVHVGNLTENLRWNVDFSGIGQVGVFVKYVVMIALVGSLESLLTVKAIDMQDPYRRTSDANKDIMAVGIGNTLSALVGGLPMISEVARSAANISYGARTRWANFFHGFFLMVFLLLALPVIELIPNTALAAMLISVGIKLAHPKEFVHIFQIGKEQLAIFLATIFFTLYEDLLVGIAAGILLKMVIHLYHGASIASLFRSDIAVSFDNGKYLVSVGRSAVFTNYLALKAKLEAIPAGMDVTLDLGGTRLVDHTVMDNVRQFEHHYTRAGGTFRIQGLDAHQPFSGHQLSARRKAVPA